MKVSFPGAYQSHKGKFELAGNGNILVDEISEIPLELQSKLLRVLEDRRFTRIGGSTEVAVEARIIAATNKDLKQRVEVGCFRDDLYYRLNVFPIYLYPLRTRKEDIPEIANHLLPRIGQNCGLAADGITDAAISAILEYDWPGNVRKLRNVLERGLVLAGGGVVDLGHLPVEIQERYNPEHTQGGRFVEKVDSYKKEILLDALRERSTGVRKMRLEIWDSPSALSAITLINTVSTIIGKPRGRGVSSLFRATRTKRNYDYRN